ncbi:CBS domain-containing protein [Candidatus Woesearchaeota archaeon]|nr:CBS domain-containing protein [Candidatus Woesearchaeota archaeon]
MARVSRIMLADVPTLKKEAKIEEAAKLLSKTENGCVIIVDDNRPVGIVTELDLVRKIATGRMNMKSRLSEIMTSPVVCMTPDMKLDEALKMIDTKRFRKYPVIGNGTLVGLVTKNDIVHAISDNVRLHRAIQNIVLILFVVFELFVFLLYKPLINYLGA